MGLVIKFSEALLILQISLISSCISQMKVGPILLCTAMVSTRTHTNLRPKHSCFQVAGTSRRKRCDLINDLHSFVVTQGRDKVIRMGVVEGKQEREVVFFLEKKNSCNDFQISISVLIQILYFGDLLDTLGCLIILSSLRRLQGP